MKKLLIVVLLLLTTLIIAPKFIGSIVEEERKNLVTEINQSNDIKLTTSQYNTGWFGADVVSEIELSLVDEGLENLTIKLVEELSFGPLIITDDSWYFGLGYSSMKFTLSDVDIDDSVLNLINERLHVAALYNFNQNITTFIQTDNIRYQDSEGILVAEPSSSEFTLINDKRVVGDFSWGGLTINTEEERFVVGAITMSTDQEIVSGNYFEGTAILTGVSVVNIDSIIGFKDNIKAFAIANASLASDVTVNDDLLAIAIDYKAGEVSASGEYFKEANLALVLNNLNIEALQTLNTTLANLPTDIDEEKSSEEVLRALSDIAEQVLSKDPNLKITDLSVVTSEGKIASDFAFHINKDLIDVNNLDAMSLIPALAVSGKGRVPMAFLAKFGMEPVVDNFVTEGYLTVQDDTVTFDASYIDTVLTLNGNVFPL